MNLRLKIVPFYSRMVGSHAISSESRKSIRDMRTGICRSFLIFVIFHNQKTKKTKTFAVFFIIIIRINFIHTLEI